MHGFHATPVEASLFGVLAIASLLLAFVMLGSRWLRHYLIAFAAESWAIAALSAAVGYIDHYPELYVIALLTLAFRGTLLPYLLLRIVRRLTIERELEPLLRPSSSLVLGAGAVVFSLVVAARMTQALHLTAEVVVLALTVMLSMKLIGPK